MMTRSRFGKQIEICQRIKSMKNESQIMTFLKVWSKQLNCNNEQRLLSKLFICTKCELSSTAINIILDSFDNSKIQSDHENKSKSRIESLPNDIFNNLASFLTVDSNLNFSICNHRIHKMVHNDNYFDQCIDNRQFVLTPRKLILILKNNSHLFCFLNQCNVFALSSDKKTVTNDNDNIHFYDWNCDDNCNDYDSKCIFCKLIARVNVCRQTKNNYKFNYALNWFPKLLSNIKKFVICNNLVCVLHNLPMKWLLSVNNNRWVDISGLESQSSRKKGIKYSYECQLRNTSTELFCNKYNDYISSIGDNYKSNNCKVRQIDCLRYNVDMDISYFGLLSKLHSNYNHVTINIGHTRLDCESIKEFFSVFHAKMHCLTLKCQSITIKNDSVENVDIASTFFKRSSKIYNEFATNKLATESGTSWMNNNDNIKTIKICESVMKRTRDYNIRNLNGLLSFLNNVKLINSLNIYNSVEKIQLTLFNFESFGEEHILNDIIFNHIEKFKKIKHVRFRLAFNFKRCFAPVMVHKFTSFYKLFWKLIKQKYMVSSLICGNNNNINIKFEFLWFPSILVFKKWNEFDGINYVHYVTQQNIKCEHLNYDIQLSHDRLNQCQNSIVNVEKMFWHDWDNQKYQSQVEKGISKMNCWKHSFNLQHSYSLN